MEISIITKIEFFEFMKAFFTDAAKYAKLTQAAKKPHFFMWRRMLSIQYPMQMSALSGLDDVRIMDVLHKNFCSSSYPKWMYTSSKNSQTKQKESILKKYTRDVIDYFMDMYSFDWNSLLALEQMNEKMLYDELNIIDTELHPTDKQIKKKTLKKK